MIFISVVHRKRMAQWLLLMLCGFSAAYGTNSSYLHNSIMTIWVVSEPDSPFGYGSLVPRLLFGLINYITSEHHDGGGSNPQCDTSHMLTCMHTIAKIDVFRCTCSAVCILNIVDAIFVMLQKKHHRSALITIRHITHCSQKFMAQKPPEQQGSLWPQIPGCCGLHHLIWLVFWNNLAALGHTN